jgi:hypothetical protein
MEDEAARIVSWWTPASLRPRAAPRNSWPQVVATSVSLAALLLLFLGLAEPSNGNGSTLQGDAWWLCAYLLVVTPSYLVALRALGSAVGLALWIPFALLTALLEFVWYGLYCAGSW